MLSDEPQVHDAVYDPDYGRGTIIEIDESMGIIVEFISLDDVVYYWNPPDDSELQHRFTICSLCGHKHVLGRLHRRCVV